MGASKIEKADKKSFSFFDGFGFFLRAGGAYNCPKPILKRAIISFCISDVFTLARFRGASNLFESLLLEGAE